MDEDSELDEITDEVAQEILTELAQKLPFYQKIADAAFNADKDLTGVEFGYEGLQMVLFFRKEGLMRVELSSQGSDNWNTYVIEDDDIFA